MNNNLNLIVFSSHYSWLMAPGQIIS